MKFDMGQAWSEAVRLFRANWKVLLTLAGLFAFLPQIVLVIAMPGMMTGAWATELAESSNPEAVFAELGTAVAGFFLIYLVLIAVQIIGQLAMAAAADDEGQHDLGQSLAIAVRALPTMIGVFVIGIIGYFAIGLLIALVIGGVVVAVSGGGDPGVGAILLMIPVVLGAIGLFLYLMMRFSMILPVVVLGGEGNPFKAFGKSWRLTAASAWSLLAYYVLLFIVYMVISTIFGIVFGGMAAFSMVAGDFASSGQLGPGMWLYMIASAALGAVAGALFVTIVVAVWHQLAGTGRAAVADTFD